MDFPIVITLIVLTLGAALVFALLSKFRVDKRKKDPHATKSTLARDKDSKGTPADT